MDPKLAALARLYGIRTSYTDMKRKTQRASADSVLLALKALGAPVAGMDDVPNALQQRRRENARRDIEPVTVAWNGKLRQPLRLPHADSKSILVLEDGTETKWSPSKRLPNGYHTLRVSSKGRLSESLIISAPEHAHFPLVDPAWGVFVPVYSLQSERSMGAGDLTDLESVINWVHNLGGRAAATLPLLAAFLDKPFEPSPYSPVSRLFWNEFYVDPERAREFETTDRRHRNGRLKPLVDYREGMAQKRQVLEAMAKRYFAQSNNRWNPEVEDYARFRAVTESQGKGWRRWPQRLRDGDIRPGDYNEDIYRYHLYAQSLIQKQIQHLSNHAKHSSCMLYLDLPAGLHADGYDTWRYQDLFVQGMSVGAPPDPMFTTGQNWNFPPMDPHSMRTSRYRYTIAYIRNHLRYAPLLRIDHVMGLHRLYWIPEGLSGDQGLYVEYPAEEMYAILSVESHRHGAGIVGENLGLVPPEVNTAMARHQIQKLYIVQSELSSEPGRNPLGKPGDNTVASLNTHDMAPFKAFMDGIDITDRIALNFIDEKDAAKEKRKRKRLGNALRIFLKQPDVFGGCIKFLGKSQARLVLVNLEDLWGETQPQNIPATTTQRPNWRRRLRYSIEDLQKKQKIPIRIRDSE